ncbi:hypothetical protein D1006_29875 [Burkholderia stabilis]|uniref:Uncharacterized protein n=1 Tax=Burkholderia stabilis TaxID=95485 RepID=A0A4Q2AH47_9BURK|nr:hypothetical protein D1006_29875 [Burkholderia stabilis]
MTGHNDYSFHRLAAFAYAGCRSTGGRLPGLPGARHVRLDILAETVRHLVTPRRRQPASVSRDTHGKPVAAALRDDDSR